MGLGKLTEFFGHYGIRNLWKMLLAYTAITLLNVWSFTQEVLDFEVGGLSLLRGRYILAGLLGLMAWMMHKNQF